MFRPIQLSQPTEAERGCQLTLSQSSLYLFSFVVITAGYSMSRNRSETAGRATTPTSHKSREAGLLAHAVTDRSIVLGMPRLTWHHQSILS